MDTPEKAVEAVSACLDLRGGAKRLAIDEESGTDPSGETVTLLVGFCPAPWEVWVFPYMHPEWEADQYTRLAISGAVKTLLRNKIPKAMHHGSYDQRRFEAVFETSAVNYNWDTQYSVYLCNPTLRSYSLNNLADRVEKCKGYKSMMAAYLDRDGRPEYYRAPLDVLSTYNAMDCHVTQMLCAASHDAPAGLVKAYTEAAFTVEDMQYFGPKLDTKQADALQTIFPKEQRRLASRIRKLAGDPNLNPNSPLHLKAAIFGTWKLKSPHAFKSTNKETLRILEHRTGHKGIVAIREYREAKNRAERVAAFQRSAEAHNGRVTTFWWLTGTRTGRLSSGGGSRNDKRALGNLQNIPSDTLVKNILVSDWRWRAFAKAAVKRGTAAAMKEFADIDVFVARDYSQMELRVMAQVSGEDAMIAEFNSGRDIHAAIGSLWSKWDYKTIRKDANVRRIVKGLHFGIIYGLGAKGLKNLLAQQGTEVAESETQRYIEQYWKRFKKIARYRTRVQEHAAKHGHVTNLFGFKIPIEVKERDGAWWKNQAVNAPIQGGAHQVLLCALALLRREGEKYPDVRPQMEVHDSLVCVAPLKDVMKVVEQTQRLVETRVREVTAEDFGIEWKVPLVTDIQIGFRYGELTDLEGDNLETALRGAVTSALANERKLRKLTSVAR